MVCLLRCPFRCLRVAGPLANSLLYVCAHADSIAEFGPSPLVKLNGGDYDCFVIAEACCHNKQGGMVMPKVGVCLPGCGFLDGSEIHEAVFTLLALDQAGAEIVCCAPDKPQFKVVDHGQQADAAGQTRNVLTESARIARCEIVPLKQVNAKDIDALVFPGGFGAALNLCTFGVDGPNCSVDPDVESLVSDMVEMKKPIGAICIAPALLARILGRKNIPAKLTIGTDPGTAGALTKMGAKHCDCPATEMVADHEHRVVTTPAYMLAKGPAEVHQGISKAITELLKMIG